MRKQAQHDIRVVNMSLGGGGGRGVNCDNQNRAMKEAFQRLVARKVAIFGSARTPEDHPDYLAAKAFSQVMARAGWMSITGAGDGIMKAGHEGPQREASFGLSIRLPFETTADLEGLEQTVVIIR